MKEKSPLRPQAIALGYDGKRAPTVLAAGSGELAQRILDIAAQHHIPLHEDPQLVAALSTLKLGEEIPEALYHVIAQVIAFAYFLTRRPPPR